MGMPETEDRIAVVGLAGRFPGARTVEELWTLLKNGSEARSELTAAQLAAAGVSEQLLRTPHYVRSCMKFEGAELFDAEFFGYSLRQAANIDPQQRHFLECAWEALESAGHGSIPQGTSVGVFAGSSSNGHLFANLLRDGADPVDAMQAFIDADKDYLTSRVSYKLGLTGPSVTVQTACSTSLVAVHLACRSLLDFECDIGLAGGAAISIPGSTGYLYVEGGIKSPDGHCRAFDAGANGTVAGSGVAIVVLRRLADAIADRDPIHAVIRSTVVNNDGSRKAGFTAPGLQSQVQLLASALELADLSPTDIGMLEAHGTGTVLGDAIELEALNQVYGKVGAERFCALGSVKTNIGHLDAAAGVAGLIKAVLCLRHQSLVPTVNFSRPSALLSSPNCAFYVNTEARPWVPSPGQMRRAAVSSFGLGGTNAHAILEEAPELVLPAPESSREQIFPLSARDPGALRRMADNLAEFIATASQIRLSDVAYTLQEGRRKFDCRQAIVASDAAELVRTLRAMGAGERSPVTTGRTANPVFWMFPGQGAQQPAMAAGLYRTDTDFRRDVDECADKVAAILGFDVRQLICEIGPGKVRTQHLDFVQPALFVVEYCLARVLMRCGVRPHAVIGHGFGEYAAACVAGILSLDDAISLVTRRAQLVATLSPGATLMVCLPEARVRELKRANVHIAAVNSHDQCVVAGEPGAVHAFEKLLRSHGIEHYRLLETRAFHSPCVAPVVAALREAAARLAHRPPQIPFVSCLTGQFVSESRVADSRYWSDHLVSPVKFSSGLAELARTRGGVFVEVGPGTTLTGLAQHGLASETGVAFISCLAAMGDTTRADLLGRIGDIWAQGGDVDWVRLHDGTEPRRLSLPTYPFDRRPAIDLGAHSSHEHGEPEQTASNRLPFEQWFYLPSWRRSMPPAPFPAGAEGRGWLVLEDAFGFGTRLSQRLRSSARRVVTVTSAAAYAEITPDSFTVDPTAPEHYVSVLERLRANGGTIDHVVHCWSLTGDASTGHMMPGPDGSLLFLARAFVRTWQKFAATTLVVTNESQNVCGDDPVDPAKAMLPALCKVICQEHAEARCRVVDLPPPQRAIALEDQYERYAEKLLAETQTAWGDRPARLSWRSTVG